MFYESVKTLHFLIRMLYLRWHFHRVFYQFLCPHPLALRLPWESCRVSYHSHDDRITHPIDLCNRRRHHTPTQVEYNCRFCSGNCSCHTNLRLTLCSMIHLSRLRSRCPYRRHTTYWCSACSCIEIANSGSPSSQPRQYRPCNFWRRHISNERERTRHLRSETGCRYRKISS